MNIIIALVVGLLVYLVVKTVVALVKQVAQFAEPAGIVAGAVASLRMLGII